MKKFLFIVFSLSFVAVNALFVEVKDSSSQNRFLGVDVKMCATSGKEPYDCGNSAVSNVLNLNLLEPLMHGKQVYLFNDFITWIGEQSQAEEYDETALKYSESATDAKIAKAFPAPGTYMIVLGSSSYLKKTIAPTKICPEGESLVMAQLKYNNGNLIYAWSQDAICAKPQDSFSLQISTELDNTIPESADDDKPKSAKDTQGIDWMNDLGPNSIYQKASKSPRKVRLIKSGGSSKAGGSSAADTNA